MNAFQTATSARTARTLLSPFLPLSWAALAASSPYVAFLPLGCMTVPIDVVIGRERTQRSQVVKQADVVALMALLPEEQRTAIILKEYHGMTFQEIADMQGCPLSTVKTRLYQGLTVLRRHLEKNGQMTPQLVKRK